MVLEMKKLLTCLLAIACFCGYAQSITIKPDTHDGYTFIFGEADGDLQIAISPIKKGEFDLSAGEAWIIVDRKKLKLGVREITYDKLWLNMLPKQYADIIRLSAAFKVIIKDPYNRIERQFVGRDMEKVVRLLNKEALNPTYSAKKFTAAEALAITELTKDFLSDCKIVIKVYASTNFEKARQCANRSMKKYNDWVNVNNALLKDAELRRSLSVRQLRNLKRNKASIMVDKEYIVNWIKN